MELFEKHLSTKDIFEGKIIKVKVDTVLLENNQEAFREVVLHSGGVCIVPIDDENNVYMVRQFRYPYAKALLEVPAGKKNIDEDPLLCGIRELEEEVGAIAKEITYLGEMYPTPGYNNEIISIYLAKGLSFTKQNLDDGEFLNVEKYQLDTLVGMVLNNEIKDGKTQIAILKTKMMLGK